MYNWCQISLFFSHTYVLFFPLGQFCFWGVHEQCYGVRSSISTCSHSHFVLVHVYHFYKKEKEKKKYYKISVFLIKKLMLQSDPLISLWTLYWTPRRERRDGPWPRFLLRPRPRNAPLRPRAQSTRQCMPRNAAGWVSLIQFLFLHSSFLSLFSSPPSGARWPRCFGSVDSALCAGVRDAAAGQPGTGPCCGFGSRLLPSLPPLFTHHPHTNFPVLAAPPVSYFGISCLNNSFRPLHFKFSLL